MSKRKDDEKLLGSVGRIKELYRNEKNGNEAQLGNALSIGKELAFIKATVRHGQFGKYISQYVGFQTSQCNVYLRVYQYRDDIKTAQSWAEGHGLACSTVSDFYKLIPKWKRRDNPVCPTGDKPPAFSLTNITIKLRDDIAAAHAILSGASQDNHVDLEGAEISLWRLAGAYNVRVQRLLKEVGLEVPALLLEKMQSAVGQPDFAEQISGTAPKSVSPCTEAVTVAEAPIIPDETAVSPEIADAPRHDDSAAEQPVSEQKDANSDKDVLVTRSVPTLRNAETGRRAGQNLCRKGADRMLELDRAGIDSSAISEALKDFNLDFRPDEVEKYLARNSALTQYRKQIKAEESERADQISQRFVEMVEEVA